MQSDKSPFPAYWWGTGLENVGLEAVRPDMGTYGRYEFARLPPAPLQKSESFDWLATAQPHAAHIGLVKAIENAQALADLHKILEGLALCLPPEFVKFMETPALQERIRSNTDCFLDLCPEPVRSPLGEGYLIRFLADSQGCLFWYLYLTENGKDHAVVSSPGFYGIEQELWSDEQPNPLDIVFSAESFEIFLWRFWLENEIWYADYEGTAMPETGNIYIEQYRQ